MDSLEEYLCNYLPQEPLIAKFQQTIKNTFISSSLVKGSPQRLKRFKLGDPTNGIFVVLEDGLEAIRVNEIGEEAMLMFLDQLTSFGK
jgi:hypothetical protein